MALFSKFRRRLAVKATIENARELSRFLAKAFASAQLSNPENSYNDNLKLALQARPEWDQIDDHTFQFKNKHLTVGDKATLKDMVIMVSENELLHSNWDIPSDELDTLDMIAREEIEKCFEVS
jgi:hypothetical protein